MFFIVDEEVKFREEVLTEDAANAGRQSLLPRQLVNHCRDAGSRSLAEADTLQTNERILAHMQDAGERGLANHWGLQLKSKLGIDHGAGGSGVDEESEWTGAVDGGLHHDQVSAIQAETDYVIRRPDLR